MFMDMIGIDLFDQNISSVCAKVRLRCSWISLLLIYLIKMWVIVCAEARVRVYMDITSVDSFDQNVGMVCVKVRLRYLCRYNSVWIYLIKMLAIDMC